jgi:ABC-2 type transport system ATP-binding protein
VARPVIVARGVSKRFVSHSSKATQLKERFVKGRGGTSEEFWALRDVDVVVGEGETVGLIGPERRRQVDPAQGARPASCGPTSGEVEVQGASPRCSSSGPASTASCRAARTSTSTPRCSACREEVDGLLDSIVEFSEQGPRIDDPVKHYSSGEYVKLAFSIAVHVDPDICSSTRCSRSATRPSRASAWPRSRSSSRPARRSCSSRTRSTS